MVAFARQYDAEGNRTSRYQLDGNGDPINTTTYDWDNRNRLIAVRQWDTDTSGTCLSEVDYKYDAFDRLVDKSVAGGAEERYVYDGQNLLLVLDNSGSVVERELYGAAVDQILASEDAANNVTWMLSDNQGTVRDVAERVYDSGNDTWNTQIVDHLIYTAFGRIASETNSSARPRFTYTGRQWDADAQVFYFRGRWYGLDGRFLSEDPSGLRPDTNPYRYCGNSPTNYTDPSGLEYIRPGSPEWGLQSACAPVGIRNPSGGGTPVRLSTVEGAGGSAAGIPLTLAGFTREETLRIAAHDYVQREMTQFCRAQDQRLAEYNRQMHAITAEYFASAHAAPGAVAPNAPANPNAPGYWDRYLQHVDAYAINVGPYACAMAGGLWPKSWSFATGGRGPFLTSPNPLTSVPRAVGIPGAGSTIVRTGAAGIGCATVAIGFYNWGVFIGGFFYAAFPGSNGLDPNDAR